MPRSDEPRYTRAEWDQIQREEECQRNGHDFNITVSLGNIDPQMIHCSRCRRFWDVKRNG